MNSKHRQRKKEFTRISQINVKSFALIDEDFDLAKYLINDAYIMVWLGDSFNFKMIERTYESLKTLSIAQQCLFANENERLLIFKAPHQAKNKDKLNEYEIKLIAKAMKKIHQDTIYEYTLSEPFPIVLHKAKQNKLLKKIEKATMQTKTVFSHCFISQQSFFFGFDKVHVADFFNVRFESPLLDLAAIAYEYHLNDDEINLLLSSYFGKNYGVRKKKLIPLFIAYHLLFKLIHLSQIKEKIESNDSILDNRLQLLEKELIDKINSL